MKRFLKAEWELYKKNTGRFIAAMVCLFAYTFLLLFSGIFRYEYVAFVSMMGFLAAFLLWLPLYICNFGRKTGVSTEQFLLCLGETKRIYLQIRLVAVLVLLFGMLLLTALMQIPAALLAPESYRITFFLSEASILTADICAAGMMAWLVPSRYVLLVLPGWVGFHCGIMAGFLSGTEKEEMSSVFSGIYVYALLMVALFIGAYLFRYLRTVRQERGRKKDRIRSEEERK